MVEDEPVTAPVIEFGKAFVVTGTETPAVNELINHDIKKHEDLLDYLKVVIYLDKFHRVDAPSPIDRLDRFKNVGWYGRFASPGYTAFAEHFRCRKTHFNDDPDLRHIWGMIKLYLKNKFDKESESE